ncbi:MAG: IS1595 family transposase, partial [Deltaproteobacteria bacterium]|nr:IS1595 family transposase [Deltaproteobacteria bacterium]
MDDAYLGGVREGKREHGAEGKTRFVAALETTEDWLPHRIKLQVVADFRLKAIENWCHRSVAPVSKVYSDGLPCFGAVATAGCLHAQVVAGGGKASVRVKEFAWLNTVIGNAETALRSTHHSMKGKYAQRYLSEFERRFNRRYDLPSMVP